MAAAEKRCRRRKPKAVSKELTSALRDWLLPVPRPN
jgi:hypothetical protein